jgi:hypothetical protein
MIFVEWSPSLGKWAQLLFVLNNCLDAEQSAASYHQKLFKAVNLSTFPCMKKAIALLL